MKRKIAFITLLIVTMVSFTMAFATAFAASGDAYLYSGDTSVVTTYSGRNAATLASEDAAPNGQSGKSFVYSNTAGAGATYAFVSQNAYDINSAYDAARFIVYVDGDMTSWTVQLGIFSTKHALSGGALISDYIMDASGVRWGKNSGVSTSLVQGWNEIILPVNSLDGIGGFSRDSYVFSSDASAAASERAGIDGFAVRTHSGSTPFTLKIYAAQLVKLSAGITAGVSAYTGGTPAEGMDPEEPEEPDEALDEVTLVFSSVGGFDVFEGETINGTEVYSFGKLGNAWGGNVVYMKLDKNHNVSKVAESGKGALSYYLYIADENTLEAYTDLSGGWNIDVCSDETYNDTNKYTFELSGAYAGLQLGWNHVIAPFVAANEKRSINWSTVRTIRFNYGGAGLGGGQSNIKIADMRFVQTDYVENVLEDDDLVEFVSESVTGVVGGAVPTAAETVDGKSVTVYAPNGWGGFVSVLNLDKTYDLTSLVSSEHAVFTMKIYFETEEDIDKYAYFNVDIGSGSSYTDTHKYCFGVSGLFEKCKVGWNTIVIPLSKANEKNAMDWADVNFIRLNVGGSLPTQSKTARYGITLNADFTQESEGAVLGWVDPADQPEEPTENVRIECGADSGLHLESCDTAWSGAQLETAAGFVKQGSGSVKWVGQGTAGSSVKLPYSYDLTDYDCISFKLYTDNAKAFLAMADGQFEMTAKGGRDDSAELSWSLKTLTLKDGWNDVVLYMGDAINNTADITAINFINVYFVGLPQSCTVIIDDIHAHKSQGILIEGFESGFSTYTDVKEGKVGFSTNFSGEGYVARVKMKGGAYVDIADADTIAMWIYAGDEYTTGAIAGTELEISSSGTCDVKELAFFFPNDLKIGWNYVTWKISEGRSTGGAIDLTKVNFVGFVKTGLNRIDCRFDDLRAVESRFITEAKPPMDGYYDLVSGDKLVEGVFEGMTIDDEEYKEGVGALCGVYSDDTIVLQANFAPVSTGLSLEGENELGIVFWLYIDDVSAVTNAFIELSSSPAADSFELEWNLVGLENGWNWIALKATDAARVGGVMDTDAIVRVRLVICQSGERTVRIDCMRIVNSNSEGVFVPVDEKRVLEPIDALLVSDAETEWTNTTLNTIERKEGYSSVQITNDGSVSSVTALTEIDVGETDLLYINVRENNELGVTLWLYVEDLTKVTEITFRLSSSASASDNYLEWAVAGIENGWNWVVLKATDASLKGIVDADDLRSVSVKVSAAPAEGGYEIFKVLADRVSVVNAAVTENTNQPTADETKTRNPVRELVIIDCDSTSGTTFSGNKVDKEDFRYSTGAVYTSGAGYALNATDLEVGKTDLTKDTLVLAFWIWIEDITLYDNAKVNSQIELSSSNAYDREEIFWDLGQWLPGLENGWNWLVLKGSDATVQDRMPDFDNLKRFRIYVNEIATSSLKIDRVTIGYIGNESLFAEPDFENEKANSGVFKGANALVAENDTFIKVDFAAAEDYVSIKSGSDTDGCYGGISAGSVILAAIAFGVSAAFAFRKKRN